MITQSKIQVAADYVTAVVIALSLTALALAYFDVLTFNL